MTVCGVVLAGCFLLVRLLRVPLDLVVNPHLRAAAEEPELVCVGVVVVVVGVVVTGGGVVDCGGDGVLVGGGGGGGGGPEPVPAYAEMVSTEPTANSRNDAPTNPKKPLVFIYPRMSVRRGRRCTTSYYEQSEPSMSRPGRLGPASRNLPLYEDAIVLHVSSVPAAGPVENPTPLLLFVYGRRRVAP